MGASAASTKTPETSIGRRTRTSARPRPATVEVRRHALSRLAVLLRRQDRHAEAATAWQDVLDLAAGDGALTPLARRAALALAIHHEHRARDLDAAKLYADTLRAESAGRSRQEADYRVNRLKRKIRSANAERLYGKTLRTANSKQNMNVMKSMKKSSSS